MRSKLVVARVRSLQIVHSFFNRTLIAYRVLPKTIIVFGTMYWYIPQLSRIGSFFFTFVLEDWVQLFIPLAFHGHQWEINLHLNLLIDTEDPVWNEILKIICTLPVPWTLGFFGCRLRNPKTGVLFNTKSKGRRFDPSVCVLLILFNKPPRLILELKTPA